LLQKAKAFQKSEAFKEYRQLCQVAEHRIARLMQLGIRQARYLSRKKTLFQLLMAATMAYLTLVAGKTGQMRSGRGRGISFSSPFFLLFFEKIAPRFLSYSILSPKNRLFDCASSVGIP
jgi:hypothetical protein